MFFILSNYFNAHVHKNFGFASRRKFEEFSGYRKFKEFLNTAGKSTISGQQNSMNFASCQNL